MDVLLFVCAGQVWRFDGRFLPPVGEERLAWEVDGAPGPPQRTRRCQGGTHEDCPSLPKVCRGPDL